MRSAPLDRFFLAVFIPLTLLAVLLAIFSLEWRVAHDTSVLLYEAYLMDHHGYVPYRDFWDINLPGTHLLHILIGRLTGYSNGVRLRVFDVAYLTALLAMTSFWLRRLGWKVAWSASALFALLYLFSDSWILLQREYLALLPIMGAVVTSTSFPGLDERARNALVGFLFGLLATMKPHLALGLPAVVFFGLLEMRERALARGARSGVLAPLLCAGAGFCLPVLATWIYLAGSGALPYFVRIVRGYYPLYRQVNGDLTVLPPGPERARYVLRSFFEFGGRSWWLLPAGMGVFAAFAPGGLDRPRKRRVLLLCALAGVYSIYPVLTGQFFFYHWWPFVFFLILLSGLCFVDHEEPVGALLRWLPPAVLVLAICLRADLVPAIVRVLEQRYVEGMQALPFESPAVDAIADYLRERVRPGDKVQPLDWVEGGVLQAMLTARVETATPYLTDMVFYYKTSDPYVQGIREDFLRRLRASPPRYVVWFRHAPWLKGPDTTGDFPELWRFIEEHYTVAADLGTHAILERAPVRSEN